MSPFFIFVLSTLFCFNIHGDFHTHPSRLAHKDASANRLFSNYLQNQYITAPDRNEAPTPTSDESKMTKIKKNSLLKGPIKRWWNRRKNKFEQKWFDYKMHFVEELLTTYLDGGQADFDEIFSNRLHHFLSVITRERPQPQEQSETQPEPEIHDDAPEQTEPDHKSIWFPRVNKLFHRTHEQTQQTSQQSMVPKEKEEVKTVALEGPRNKFLAWLKKIAKEFIEQIKTIGRTIKDTALELQRRATNIIREIIKKVARSIFKRFITYYQNAIVKGYNSAKQNMADGVSVECKAYEYTAFEKTDIGAEPDKAETHHPFINWLRNWWRQKAFNGAIKVADLAYAIAMVYVDNGIEVKVDEYLQLNDEEKHIGDKLKLWVKKVLVQFFMRLVDVAKVLAEAIFDHLKRALAKGTYLEYHAEVHPPKDDVHPGHGPPPRRGHPADYRGPRPPGGFSKAMMVYDNNEYIY